MPTISPQLEQRFLLSNISWQAYTHLLRIFANRPSVRLTYDRGSLELMTLSHEHESLSYLLGRLVDALTEEMGLPVKGGKSTTFRRRKRQRGLEADNCWWITNEARVRGKSEIDLRHDPPPDLAVEVDITHSSLDRLAIYARLGFPEIWRFEDNNLVCHLLGTSKRYTTASTSQLFSGLVLADVACFLHQRGQQDDNAIVRQFRAWLRQWLAARPAGLPAP